MDTNSSIVKALNVIAYITLFSFIILAILYIIYPYRFTPDGPSWITLISYFSTGIIGFVFLKSWIIIIKCAEKYLAQ